MIFVTVFITLVCSACTALLVTFRKLSLRNKKEIGKVTILVLQIVGYVLTAFIWAIVPTLYYRVGLDLDVLILIPVAVAVPYVIAVVLTEYLRIFFVRRKQSKEEHSNEPVEEQYAEQQQVEEQAETMDPTQEQTDEVQHEEQPVEQQVEEQDVAQQEEQVAEKTSAEDSTDSE